MISKADLCLFGLETTDGQGEIGPARKRTGFMTSSWTVAEELQRTCDGKGHVHNPLLERRAKGADVYPPELCRAICRGVSRQKLMDETGQVSSAPMSKRQVSALINSVKWKDEVHEDDGGHDVGGSRPQDGRAILREEMQKWEEAWDDVTGAELEPQRVAQARQDEMEFFRKMNAYTRCPRARIEEEKGKLIDVRWIDTKRVTPQTLPSAPA